VVRATRVKLDCPGSFCHNSTVFPEPPLSSRPVTVTFCPATDGSGLEEIVSCAIGQAGSAAPSAEYGPGQHEGPQQEPGQQGAWQQLGTTSAAATGGPQHGVDPGWGGGQTTAPAEPDEAPNARNVTTRINGTSRRRITTSEG
jgi:hypothetical protein